MFVLLFLLFPGLQQQNQITIKWTKTKDNYILKTEKLTTWAAYAKAGIAIMEQIIINNSGFQKIQTFVTGLFRFSNTV